jgi:hypothetical protein
MCLLRHYSTTNTVICQYICRNKYKQINKMVIVYIDNFYHLLYLIRILYNSKGGAVKLRLFQLCFLFRQLTYLPCLMRRSVNGSLSSIIQSRPALTAVVNPPRMALRRRPDNSRPCFFAYSFRVIFIGNYLSYPPPVPTTVRTLYL